MVFFYYDERALEPWDELVSVFHDASNGLRTHARYNKQLVKVHSNFNVPHSMYVCMQYIYIDGN